MYDTFKNVNVISSLNQIWVIQTIFVSSDEIVTQSHETASQLLR